MLGAFRPNATCMVRLRLLPAVALLGFAPTAPTHAQEAGIDLHYLRLHEADLGAARMSGREQGLALQSPAFDLLGGGFTVGADYVYTHYAYSGLASRDRDLHRLAVPLQWRSNGSYTMRLAAVPTVATSSNVFKDLFSRGDGDDVNLYGSATLESAPASGWGWRAGAGYDDRFGKPQAYPVLVALYQQPGIALELGWPRTRVDWRPHERWRLGLQIAPAGRSWHVVSDERDGAQFDYVVEAWRASLSAQWTFAARWHFVAELGSEFDRHHDFEDDHGARIDEDAASTILVGFSVRYGPAGSTYDLRNP